MDSGAENNAEGVRRQERPAIDVMQGEPLLANRRPAGIIDAYTDAMRRLDANAEATYEKLGRDCLLRESVTSFENAIHGEAEEQPFKAAELFIHTLSAEDPNARLLTANAVDAITRYAPRLTLDIYSCLLMDEYQPVRERAAVFFLMERARFFSGASMESDLKPVLQLVAENFPDNAATVWTDHRGSGHWDFE